MGHFVGWATWWLLGLLAVLLLFAWFAWEWVEEKLRHRLVTFVSNKLGGIEVTLGLLKIRHWGLEFRDLQVGNSPGEFSAPFFLRLKLLRVTVDGVLNLLSLPGIMRIGPTWRFALGSSRRIIETIDMEGLHVHVEEKKVEGEPAVNNAGAFKKIRDWHFGRRERRLNKIWDQAMEWKAKWKIEEKEEMEEDGNEANDSPDGLNSRSEHLKDWIMKLIHTRRTNSLVFNVQRRLSESTTTQIGRWTCKDFTVNMEGHVVTLGDEGWELRGFVGSDQDLLWVLSRTLLSKLLRDAYSNRREPFKEFISNLKEKAGNLVGWLAGGLQRRVEQNQQKAEIGGTGGDESPEREVGSGQERRPGAAMLRACFAGMSGMLRRNKDTEEKEA